MWKQEWSQRQILLDGLQKHGFIKYRLVLTGWVASICIIFENFMRILESNDTRLYIINLAYLRSHRQDVPWYLDTWLLVWWRERLRLKLVLAVLDTRVLGTNGKACSEASDEEPLVLICCGRNEKRFSNIFSFCKMNVCYNCIKMLKCMVLPSKQMVVFLNSVRLTMDLGDPMRSPMVFPFLSFFLSLKSNKV